MRLRNVQIFPLSLPKCHYRCPCVTPTTDNKSSAATQEPLDLGACASPTESARLPRVAVHQQLIQQPNILRDRRKRAVRSRTWTTSTLAAAPQPPSTPTSGALCSARPPCRSVGCSTYGTRESSPERSSSWASQAPHSCSPSAVRLLVAGGFGPWTSYHADQFPRGRLWERRWRSGGRLRGTLRGLRELLLLLSSGDLHRRHIDGSIIDDRWQCSTLSTTW